MCWVWGSLKSKLFLLLKIHIFSIGNTSIKKHSYFGLEPSRTDTWTGHRSRQSHKRVTANKAKLVKQRWCIWTDRLIQSFGRGWYFCYKESQREEDEEGSGSRLRYVSAIFGISFSLVLLCQTIMPAKTIQQHNKLLCRPSLVLSDFFFFFLFSLFYSLTKATEIPKRDQSFQS